jgi:hypothetical protein
MVIKEFRLSWIRKTAWTMPKFLSNILVNILPTTRFPSILTHHPSNHLSILLLIKHHVENGNNNRTKMMIIGIRIRTKLPHLFTEDTTSLLQQNLFNCSTTWNGDEIMGRDKLSLKHGEE